MRTFLCLRRAIFPVVSIFRRSAIPSAKSTEAYGKFRELHGKRLLHRPLLICSQDLDKYWSEEDHNYVTANISVTLTQGVSRHVIVLAVRHAVSPGYSPPLPLFQCFYTLILLRSMDQDAYFHNVLIMILGAFGEPAI